MAPKFDGTAVTAAVWNVSKVLIFNPVSDQSVQNLHTLDLVALSVRDCLPEVGSLLKSCCSRTHSLVVVVS